jgi:hypothetical protein
MKIYGNFQNLEMCGIYQWSYPSLRRAPETGRIWKEGKHRCLLDSLEARDEVKQ